MNFSMLNINNDSLFMLAILLLAGLVYVYFGYTNNKQHKQQISSKQTNATCQHIQDTQHIQNVAGSWVWLLSLLFGAYWLGEVATAILILLIVIKGLHEIVGLLSLSHNVVEKGLSSGLTDGRSQWLDYMLPSCLVLMTVSWLALNQLLTENHQRSLLLFMIFVVQFNDVNQYIAGKTLGHKFFQGKLAPKLSPNKTIEGAVFGTLLTGILAVPIGFVLTEFPPFVCALVAIAMGMFGIVGDILESAFKRRHGVKDMGAWIKGHGGIMDRIDSLLLSVPVFYLFTRVYF